ncbi:MAG: hypothetical protein IKO78_01390 [Bacilli bacterium]|nr:hypothetical protein [Bacilli bacterium]
MSKRLTNDENIENLKKRKILRYLMIFFDALTLVLAILSLTIGLSLIFPLISYVIAIIFANIRKKTIINKSNEIFEVEEEIKKVHHKHKK